MTYQSFKTKWLKINKSAKDDEVDEKSLFVDIGKKPVTQRQLNLYNYFLFIKKLLRENKARDVLEVGCGRGTMSLYLAKYLGLNLSLLDSSSEAIEIVKKQFASNDISSNFYVADAVNTELNAESFDGIVSIGLAEHLDDVEGLFKEQFRLLKKGGVMISLNIPDKFSIQFLNSIMRFFKKLFGRYKEELRKDYYRNKLKPDDYKRLAEKVGFENVEITNVCPFPIFTPIKISTDKQITKIYKMILFFKRIFQKYPYKTNYFTSQAHFLVGRKTLT